MHPRETGRQYDAIASRWDETRRVSRQGADFLERAIALCSSRNRALDVGCGSGGPLIDMLIAAGFEITGVDVSKALLDIARTRYPAVEFFHDDIAEWQSELRFDLILGWDSIFHLPHGLHAVVVRKLCTYLSKGGVLLFTAGGIDSEIVGTMHGHAFHYSSLSETALIELVKRGGCVPVLMDRDQDPLHHVVIIAVENGEHAG